MMQGMADLASKINSMGRKMDKLVTKADFEVLTTELKRVTVKVDALEAENTELKLELQRVQKKHEDDRKKILSLEEQIKKKSLIFRNIRSQNSLGEAVKETCKKNLKMKKDIEITSTRWLLAKTKK